MRPDSVKEDEYDANKAYLRAVSAWEKAVNNAKQIAQDLNAIHGDWYYLVSEDIIKAIRPDLPIPSVAAQTPATNDAE